MNFLKKLSAVLILVLTVAANFVSLAKANIQDRGSESEGPVAKGGGTSCDC